MIPSVLAHHVKHGIKDFLRTTFPVTTPFFADILENFLDEPGHVFKGPYLDIQLPFSEGIGGNDCFPDIPMPFSPYLHQEKAFNRLSGKNPKPTIIATGTGSGKTECFLYPILDYCYRHRGEPGIKAILIYPMNALATDQAVRLAGIIDKSPVLKGHVTAGIYVGQMEKAPSMVMGSDRLISDKKTMRLSPPDILLTNYKMLDYLLIRSEDRGLWAHNNPDTLRFIVVDELHTFDGAQGADLACLIRRLKARLGIDHGVMCPIGTSATLGTGDSANDLLDFASAVFGDRFSAESVITESRVSAGKFLEEAFISYVDIVPFEEKDRLEPSRYNSYEDYIMAQYSLWFFKEIKGTMADTEWRFDLGRKIKEHLFFQNLLKTLNGKTRSFEKIFNQLEKVTRGLSLDRNDEQEYRRYKFNLLNSLLALVSEARVRITGNTDGEETIAIRPFLNVKIQLWLRELRRMTAEVSEHPRLRFVDDLNEKQLGAHLPVVYCRDCGCMGWSGLRRRNSPEIKGNLKEFYHAFFSHDPKVVYLFPEKKTTDMVLPEGLSVRDGQIEKALTWLLCAGCLKIEKNTDSSECTYCGHTVLIPVFIPEVLVKQKNKNLSSKDCPYCDSKNSLALLGSRAATLTSVMIVQLFSSTFNNDKKLLAFSDNVQDAAHRAGFFNSRTYRFNFRTALQKIVLETGASKTLAELPDIFIDFWKEKIDQKRYIATFLAPNMEWLSDYEYLKNHDHLPEESTLRKMIDNRIAWEIINEYGFQSRIGRTLEKTSSSVVYNDLSLLNTATEELIEKISNEIGYLREINIKELTCFLTGILMHLKNQGGIIFHGLKAFIEGSGNTYLINRIPWMPNFGPESRTPSFIIERKKDRFDHLFNVASNRITWYQSWLDKCFRKHFTDIRTTAETSRDLYRLVLDTLVKHGILEKIKAEGNKVWGIKPESLRISPEVQQFRCVKCGHNISAASEVNMYFEGAPCQRFHCDGSYKQLDADMDYYSKLYAYGDVERIFAREHTGLLKRDERDQLEVEFKSGKEEQKPWFSNLLSCTPTLEMGIDIGNLSSLVLCSVPPSQSNYLQRIGRSGRRDGNALNLTVANARPHDLYFFAEPEEMLSGHINSPGIFLNASAVLERQFTAFCLDKWIAQDETVAIPKKLGLILNNLEPYDKNKFPHNFIFFIETFQTDLFEQFIRLFKDNDEGLTPESETHIKQFIEGDQEKNYSLRHKIIYGLNNRKLEKESLQKKIKTLTGKIRKKKEEPEDRHTKDELRDLNIEKSALQDLVKNINKYDTYNFFTDEGLLPNYAFPEAGVMLSSLIYRKKQKVQKGEGSYETWNYEYERPAVNAIEELAPANTFYAEGRKVKVDQVDMTVSKIETWRFCNNCSHKELTGIEEEKSTCIKCGSPMWSDAGQKRLMLKMKQVFASTSDKNSRIGDDSDDREPVFYNKQMLVEFDEQNVSDAYKVDGGFPFGFEFLTKVEFCEINFGEKSEIGEKVTIAGIEAPRQGFSVCRNCGKVQLDRANPSHAFVCTARDQDSDANLIDCLYLYRQFTSEAIRILLPVSIVSESNVKLQSFIAAIQLGLKKKFKGKIDHLQTTLHEIPIPDSSLKKKYLILYDTVPGGTGYLKQLTQSSGQLMEILDLALNVLKSCDCHHEKDKDGCYKCLFAYRNSYTMQATSRNTAIEMLAEILSYRDRIVKTHHISDISLNAFIKSELEARFIGALKSYSSTEHPFELKTATTNYKTEYFLKAGQNAYYIEPQVELTSANGISIPSIADFLIKPARIRDQIKPIAVFLDGYAYHHDRTGKDTAQRMAIAQSNKYLVWSLSWHDVENVFKSQGDYYENFLEPAALPQGVNLENLLNGYGLESFKDFIKLNSFDLLVRFLENPDYGKWQRFIFVCGLMYFNPSLFKDENFTTQWIDSVKQNFPENLADKITEAPCFSFSEDCLYMSYPPSTEVNMPLPVKQFLVYEKASLDKPVNPYGVRIGCLLADDTEGKAKPGYQRFWNGFLRLYNFYQFLPFAFAVTTEGIKAEEYSVLEIADEVSPHIDSAEKKAQKDHWKNLMDITDTSIHPLISFLMEKNWPVPEPGYELTDEKNEIIACSELAWEDLKIAFLTDEESVYRNIFQINNWKVFLITDLLAEPDSIDVIYNTTGE